MGGSKFINPWKDLAYHPWQKLVGVYTQIYAITWAYILLSSNNNSAKLKLIKMEL